MQSHFGPVIAARAGLTVIDCRACGWAHLDPLPAVPDGYYESDFWQHEKAGWLARYEAERDWLDMQNGDWLGVVEEHANGRTLLDVGSGYGFFLHQAGLQGWRGFGIEPSETAATYSERQIFAPIQRGSWEMFPRHSIPIDCISALWLMEHLPNPLEFLVWCKAHLAPGGVLLLAVPQEWTSIQMAANQHAHVHDWFVHPTHINYWSAPTFYGLMGRAGFRVVDALATWPMEQFIRDGHDYTDDEQLGAEIHAEVRKIELGWSREERIKGARLAARVVGGRDLIVIAKVDA